MDRNSAIGLTLIAALLLVYFYWFAPKPQDVAQNPTALTSDPGKRASDEVQTPTLDSAQIASYGDLSGFVTGTESLSTIETEDLKITLSNKGGRLREVELKKFKTYTQKPLKLITADRSKFNLITTIKGKEVDLYTFFYKTEQSRKGDSTEVKFNLQLADGSTLNHIYTIPDKGYEIKYKIIQQGLDQHISGDNLTYEWNDLIQPVEKDIKDMRDHSTVTFFTTSEGFDNIAETSLNSEAITAPIRWAAIKQKFFLTSIIGENTTFTNGEIATMLDNKEDTTMIKHARIKLQLPKAALAKGASLKYYIGPNDYNLIGNVAENFNRNVYLGWPPVYWINKFVIFPVFHFLTKHISNYGLIIIILVILLKLVLAPLSYRSYLSMAKMKVLKPELDEIKEKVGDDMTKVQQEQMKLYQQVGVNPISGCIPVLLQMPILFAMFYLFPASVELRQQPFLWSEDLSTYESYSSLILPSASRIFSSLRSIFTISTSAPTRSMWEGRTSRYFSSFFTIASFGLIPSTMHS